MSTDRERKRVFISYAREDQAEALALYQSIRARGHRPWIDCEALIGGQNWSYEIEKAIRASDCFVAVVSKNSVSKRGYVQKELKTALDVLDQFPHGEIYLLPVRIDDVQIVHPALSALHIIDLRDGAKVASIRQVIKSIEHDREPPEATSDQTFFRYLSVSGSAMEAAILSRDLRTIEGLLRSGANSTDPSVSYGSPLELLLCEHDDHEEEVVISILELFFKYGALATQPCMHEASLIHQVGYLDKVNIVETLIKHGADTCHADKQGETPLIHAAAFAAENVVSLLLRHPHDINVRDHEGWTPLMWASSDRARGWLDEHEVNKMKRVINLLVENGSDLWLSNNNGETALDIAIDWEIEEIAIHLKRLMQANPRLLAP